MARSMPDKTLAIFWIISTLLSSANSVETRCYPQLALMREYGKYYDPLYQYAGLIPQTAFTTCRKTCFEERLAYMGIRRSLEHSDRVLCYCGDQVRTAPTYDHYCDYQCEGVRPCGGDSGSRYYISVDYVPDKCQQGNLCREKLCISTPMSYKCVQDCGNGYVSSNDLTRCDDINECLGSSANCNLDQLCINSIGSYNCLDCSQGYQPSSTRMQCIDVDDCRDRAPCAQICSNYPGGYNCSCLRGYDLHGESECNDVNECLSLNGGCAHDCQNTIGSYYCSCHKGYSLVNKTACTPIDPGSVGITGINPYTFGTIMGVTCTLIALLLVVVIVGGILYRRKHQHAARVQYIRNDTYLTTDLPDRRSSPMYANQASSYSGHNVYDEIREEREPPDGNPGDRNVQYLSLKPSLELPMPASDDTANLGHQSSASESYGQYLHPRILVSTPDENPDDGAATSKNL